MWPSRPNTAWKGQRTRRPQSTPRRCRSRFRRAKPSVSVKPEIATFAPLPISNSRLAALPSMVTPAVGPVIVSIPVGSFSSELAESRIKMNRPRRV